MRVINRERLKSVVESLLFVFGEEVSLNALKKHAGAEDDAQLRAALESLQRDYRDRGVRVLIKDDKIQMVSAPENAGIIGKVVKSHLSDQLSPAALETLACIAYREPIPKAEIDELRGVNSIFSLRSLSMRGLIEKAAPSPGDDARQTYYKTTLDFLKKLGMDKVSDLPQYDELSRMAEKTGQPDA